jgi:glycosyltransferase involved in cell wall biosynthesis
MMVTPYYPPHDGGVERYVSSLVRQLRLQTDWAVTVVTTAVDTSARAPSYAVEGGVGVHRLPYDLRISNTPVGRRWRQQLQDVLHREDPTVVNAHAPVPGLADLTASLVGPRPFVLTYHTGPMRKDRLVDDLLVRAYSRLVLPRTLRRADAIITGSDWVRSTLPEEFRAKAVTVHPGVDPEVFAPGEPRGDRAPVRALFVGTLEQATRYKNLPDLLRAVRSLLDGGTAITLRVVGDGGARADHERLARSLGLTGHVTFAGSLAGAALTAEYRESSFLVLPTLFDSFPTVLAEAMACGRPVISTTTGGIAELVTSGVDGLLVTPGDLPGLTAAMKTLSDDPDLRDRLGTRARQNVASRLSWEHQARRTIDVLSGVSRGRSGC